ncbi:MAG: TatD family deoxyribonuclease [Candidatus Moranbacteria bacterium GW2011_GWE2_35_2-]|nr:MAG: TatD family deoxyribonuclease [Candidatus Moranbacteria bacterium GW2011_GWE2_35_2-]KKQ22248.1 MAG: TatD family deoxyribonuclease [Candidatus Moranbacteria bacterium GW2011_GWF2_37_11]KKQ28595.1 MAG: TatD family deoxyribonuclease [Candidatus Moranbacteria bacterium GW2011_GWD1_37_17]KKQ30260.1 MAG: TatD family deoxyribonuclease [Candidatus Moranbacteria bacterium GW2011_GWE1_37_24]KKQ47492.1 MAG: TatD family deoxyribonuclease [Candidatus Moranbacteria bacterium GW2011_GWD2_37_9]HBO1671
MIDTHAHLDDRQFDKDREEVISRSFENGVEKIINVGADIKGSRDSIVLAKKYENIFAAVGLHPHCFGEDKEVGDVGGIGELAKNEKVVAIGEIGLDYFSHNRKVITGEQKENQKKGFVAQLELAQELDLPVIIHCRSSKENPTDAYDDIYEILFLSNPHLNPLPKGEGDFRMVFHCYGGNLDFTKKLLRHKNIFFSFTPNITYKIKKNIVGTKDDIMESIKIIPLKKIMLETDCPYLAPQEFRGKRSEPMYAKYAAKRIAFIKNINIDKVEKITAENADNFFRF